MSAYSKELLLNEFVKSLKTLEERVEYPQWIFTVYIPLHFRQRESYSEGTGDYHYHWWHQVIFLSLIFPLSLI